MSKLRFFSIIVLGGVCLSSFFIIRSNIAYREQKNSLKDCEEKLLMKEKQLNAALSLFKNNLIVAKENEKFKLDYDLKLIDLEGDTIYAREVFKNSALVLKYSVRNCGYCIEAEFKNLGDFSKDFSENIVIVAYYERIRGISMDIAKLKRMGLDKIRVYMIPDDDLGAPLEEHNIPYYFHLSPKLEMSNIFIPLKEQPELSEYYLKYSFKNSFNKRNSNL